MKAKLRREINELIQRGLHQEIQAHVVATKLKGEPSPAHTKNIRGEKPRGKARPHGLELVEQKEQRFASSTSSPEPPQRPHAVTRRIVQIFHSPSLRVWIKGGLTLFSPTSIGLIAALLTFYPKISVQPGTPLNPRDMFTSPFEVKYDGPIPLKSVRFSCILETATTQEMVIFQALQVVSANPRVPWMYWGDSETVFCQLPVLGLHATYSRVYITTEYDAIGLPFLHRWKVCKFESILQSDNTFRWISRTPYWSWDVPHQ